MVEVKFNYFEDAESANLYCDVKDANMFEVWDGIVNIDLGDKSYCFNAEDLVKALKPFIK